jgi:hypothetical protein
VTRQIDERRGDLSPIAKLQRALAQPASGDQRHGIGRAAVDLHKSHQPFALLHRIVDAEPLQSQHGQAHAQNLPGAHVSVRPLGFLEIFFERLHSALRARRTARLDCGRGE